MAKVKYVDELREGEQVDDYFMIKSARLGETKAGKPYLALNLADKSGEINGPVWENAESLQKICRAGNVVRVRGLVQRYRENLQLKIDTINLGEEGEYDFSSFIATSLRPAHQMEEELQQLIDSVNDVFIRTLLLEVFSDIQSGADFKKSPAAKGIHHAYLGGLLEHSLSIARVAAMLADHYRGIDRDLVVAGALLHDIGKTKELASQSGVIDYTDIGRLKGHLYIGAELVGQAAASIEDFPEQTLTHLQHLILSHHGKYEFGSPVLPMTAEALLLSFIDDLDAKMNLVEQLGRKVESETYQWSDYQRSLERYLYLRPASPASTQQKDRDHSQPQDYETRLHDTKQRSLF